MDHDIGSHHIKWNGSNDGNRVESGVYFFKIQEMLDQTENYFKIV